MNQYSGNPGQHSYRLGSQTPRLRILLADDNPGLLREFTRVLEKEFEVVSTAKDGQALIEQYDRLQPEIVVTDISMPRMDGFEAVALLRQKSNAKVIFLTVHEEQAFVEEAKALGASGYVLKRSRASVLVDAIRHVQDGEFYLSPELRE
ncbi:MAG: response regulator transcription factor [Bryobacterales bacterium]|nr:response regulator transcription factor [Bryobacterales bacterium]